MSTTIESLELEIVSNSKSAVEGIDALTQSLNKLKNATKNLGLKDASKDIKSVSDATNDAGTAIKNAAGAFTDFYHKMNMGIGTIKKIGSTIYSMVNKSMDYTENMNLFTVSMGEYASEAYKYADKVSNAMGIDPSEWIRNQGIFMTLATGFGVAGDRAATMSKNLTQLGYDIASFYNMDVNDAMLKLQSGLSGELEPLRRVGYDLSQAKLEATALELGITKSVSAMTQAEKAQLRYRAIMTQVTEVHGDMARTLDAPANQMRVFKAQVNMAAREIGNMFIPALNAIIPYAIAVARVVGYIASNIAVLFGFEKKEVEESTDTLVSGTGAVTDNLEDAQDAAKKLKSYMLGFDELNVINPNSGEDVDTSGEFEFDLPEYDFLEGLAESRVAEIVEDMKEWLGITEDIDSWADLFDTKLGDILVTVGLIGAGFAAWKVGEGVVAAISAIAGVVNGVKKVIPIISNFVGWLGAFISLVKEGGFVAAFSVAFPKLSAAIGAIAPYALPAIAIIGGLVSFVWGLVDAIKNGIDWLNALGTALGAVFTGAGIGLWAGGPTGAAIGALIGLAVGLIVDFTIFLWQKFDEIEKWFINLPLIGKVAILALVDMFLPGIGLLITAVVTFIKKWEEIKTFLTGFATWYYETVVAPIVSFLAPIVEAIWSIATLIFTKITEIVIGVTKAIVSIATKIGEIFLKIVEIFVALAGAFKTYVWTPIVEFIGSLAKMLYDNVLKPIIDFLIPIAKWIFTNIIEPIVKNIIWCRDKAVALFKDVGTTVVTFVSNLFKAMINNVLWVLETNINHFIKMLNGAITLINKIPGVNISKVELLTIPRLAEGGFVNEGQMFIAREAGAEMVGNIGRRTAVANNDQIVAGIAGGVAEANEEQNTLLREQNSLLRAILEKESGVYLDGKNLTNSVEKYQRERGRVLIAGGVI